MANRPRYIVDMALTADHKFCSEDLYISNVLYQRKLLNSPSIQKQMEAISWGQTVRLQFANADGYFTTLSATEEFRGKAVKLQRYDVDAGTTVFEAYGQITGYNLTEVAEFEFSAQDPDPLQTLLPKKNYETGDWTENSPTIINPGRDIGRPYNLCFGKPKKVPLRYVHADYTNDLYDYIIGYGPILSSLTRYLSFVFTQNSPPPDGYLYLDLTGVTDYVIQSGDILYYAVKWDAGAALDKVAFDYTCSDTTTLRDAGALDQNNLDAHPNTDISAYASGQWYFRAIALPVGHVGKTIQYFDIACENNTSSTATGLLRDIFIGDSNGVIRKAIWMSGDSLPAHAIHRTSISMSVAKTLTSDSAGTTNVYRQKMAVASSEYTVYDGSQARPYPGYAFVRFRREQKDFSGQLYDICADVDGLLMSGAAAEQNFVRIVQYLLSNATWGLGETVNAASFNTAAAATTITDLLCDGAVATPTKAQDILTKLLYPCRGNIEKNSSGEWTISVDTYQASSVATFDEAGALGPALVSVDYNRKTPTREAVKDYTLKYGHNEWTNVLTYENKRTVNATFGEDQTIESTFVRDHTTADKITSYEKALRTYGDHKLGITVGQDGNSLVKGNRITVVIPRLSINGAFQVRNIERGLDKFKLDLIAYHADIYTYVAGTMPSSANADAEADYSNTNPSSPTALAKDSEGTYQASDGTTSAYFNVSAAAPVLNFTSMLFGLRKNGETGYTWVPGVLSTGQTWIARIDGLVPGLTYDLAAVSVNAFGLKSTAATLASQLAPGDTSAPSAATSLAATGKIEGIELSWTAPTDADLAGYEVYRGTSTDPTTKLCDIGKVTKWVDRSGTMGTTYYYRLKAKDLTGNLSAYSTNANAAVGKVSGASGSGHISTGTLGTADYAGNSVTYAKRQLLEEQSISVNIAANSFDIFTITHNLGRRPHLGMPVFSSGSGKTSMFATAYGDTTFDLVVLNLSTLSALNGTIYVEYW